MTIRLLGNEQTHAGGFFKLIVTSLNHRKIYTAIILQISHSVRKKWIAEGLTSNEKALNILKKLKNPEEEKNRRPELARSVWGRREYSSPYMTYVPAENKRNIPGGDGTICAGLSHWCTRAVVRVKTKKINNKLTLPKWIMKKKQRIRWVKYNYFTFTVSLFIYERTV